MTSTAQTWHYGLVSRRWAGCGTGRLLTPYLCVGYEDRPLTADDDVAVFIAKKP